MSKSKLRMLPAAARVPATEEKPAPAEPACSGNAIMTARPVSGGAGNFRCRTK